MFRRASVILIVGDEPTRHRLAAMTWILTMVLLGGCACGTVRYELSCEEMPAVICCHCLDCQTRSGSAFDLTAFVEPSEIVLSGQLITAEHQTASGAIAAASHCAVCYSEIFNTHPRRPQSLLLRAGTLDESQSIIPAAHIFTKRRQAWITLPSGVPAFEEFPPAALFAGGS